MRAAPIGRRNALVFCLLSYRLAVGESVRRRRREKKGHVLRWTTAGESHGRALVAVVEGMVAVHVTSDDMAAQLARRRLGYGRGARMKFEEDLVTMLAEVGHGVTLGGPIAVEIGNTYWPKWETVMAPGQVDPERLAT